MFNTFDDASDHADDLVMNLRGVSDEMPDWQGGEVYEHDGYGSETVVVTGTHPVDKPHTKSNSLYTNFLWNNKKNNKKDYYK